MALDFISKSFQLSDGSLVNCMIYDTAGQERYNSINESYYQKADAVLLVYDISNRKSFEQIKNYYSPKIEENCKKNIPIILLGNKADKENQRVVSIEEGAALAVEHKFKFKETSCLKNENVADAFEALIEMWNVEYRNKSSIHIIKSEHLQRCNTGSYTMINKEKEDKDFEKAGTFIVNEHKHKKQNIKAEKRCC